MSGRGGGTHNGTYFNSNEVDHSRSNNGKQKQEHEHEQSGAAGGTVSIPAGVRKVVQSLKEVLNNVPESEIYAVLKECNMDPNETVNRILSQDTFHEVKSKRDKKKENKDTHDTRTRSSSSTVHRGGRGGLDRNGRLASSQFSATEPVVQGKPVAKKENGMVAHSSSSSGLLGNHNNRRLPVPSDYGSNEKLSHAVPGESGHTLCQSSLVVHSVWSGVPGQVSMADIVKMGRAQTKASTLPPQHSIDQRHLSTMVAVSNTSEDMVPKMSEKKWDSNDLLSRSFEADDEWPSIEQPHAPTVSDMHATDYYSDSSLPLDGGRPTVDCPKDIAKVPDHGHTEIVVGNNNKSITTGNRIVQDDGTGGKPLLERNVYKNLNSYDTHTHAFDEDEDDGDDEDEDDDDDGENDVSTVAANMQQLNMDNEHREMYEEDKPSVIIPNHLQVHGQDCSHLSFGSFGSAISSNLSGSVPPQSLKNKMDETPEAIDVQSSGLSDARNVAFYGDDHLRSAAEKDLIHQEGTSVGTYDTQPVQQPEALKEEAPEPSQASQYVFTSSAAGYSYDSTHQLSAAFSNSQISSQMPSATPFSSVAAYTNSLPSTLLPSTIHSGREPDLSYSQFPVTQALPNKFASSVASINGPSLSMSEALRAATISAAQPTQQTLAGANVATGPALLQQLALHPFSQPTLPLGHFANMISYPFVPQSYTYMPSAFQQTFAGNSTYHQSLAAMLPQYKNSVSVSSLPQSAAVASGYGFGNSSNVSGNNFPLNPAATVPAGTSLSYDDLLSSQYKDANHLLSLQQNENSPMWVQGSNSRSISGVPGNTYYNFQGQNQQPTGFRQAQQPTQQFGGLGYQNYYQAALSLEQQQQNAREGQLVNSQGQPSKQTQQLWQSSY